MGFVIVINLLSINSDFFGFLDLYGTIFKQYLFIFFRIFLLTHISKRKIENSCLNKITTKATRYMPFLFVEGKNHKKFLTKNHNTNMNNDF